MLRYRNVILGGVFAALAGAFLSMEGTNSFQQGMTAGRGFIGLAAMIVGRWTPLGALGAALLFASSRAVGDSINFFPPEGQLGEFVGQLPGQVFGVLPYVVTIIVLAGRRRPQPCHRRPMGSHTFARRSPDRVEDRPQRTDQGQAGATSVGRCGCSAGGSRSRSIGCPIAAMSRTTLTWS